MTNGENWIEEQEQALMFDRGDGGGEAIKLLEKSSTNRDILNPEQGKLLTIAKMWGGMGYRYLNNLADEVEKAQMNIDNKARQDYKDTVIQMWQGKLQNAKNNLKALM